MSGNDELELADDFDWAHKFWQSLQKGPEMEATEEVKEEKPIENDQTEIKEEVDAEQHTGNEGEMATGSSTEGGESAEPSGRGVDGNGGNGDTGVREAEDSGPTTVSVTTVRPTSDDTAPTKPESDATHSVKRRGPRFKNHRRRSSQSA